MSDTELEHGLGEVDGLGDEGDGSPEDELAEVMAAASADEVLRKPGKAKRVDEAAAAEAERELQHRWQLVGELAALSGIGPDDEVKPCPVCNMGVVPMRLEHDPTAERCPSCRGIGVVETGSLIDEHAIRPCMACAGKGFVQVQAVAPTPEQLAQVAPQFSPVFPDVPARQVA